MENKQKLQNDEFYQKGVSLYKKKNYDYAIELLSGFLQKNPGFTECRHYLWDAIRQKNILNKPPLTTLALQKLKIFFIHFSLILFQIKKDTTAAEKTIHDILMINPSNVPILFKLAHLYITQDKKEEAISTLEELLKLDRENLPALKILATTYYTNKSYEKAKIIATKILNIDPRYLPAENILKDISAIGTIEKGFDDIKPAT